jgi:hypothetical protein
MKMRDEEGHRAMQAAGEAWKKIKTRSAKTWTEWTEVIGPGLVKAQAEAKSVSNKPSGKGYNIAMGALLEEYGFGDAVERFRSKVTRADLLHCMDYLTEIEAWRQQSDASVLEAVESKQKHHYPDHITLNHPTVVWRRFAASVEVNILSLSQVFYAVENSARGYWRLNQSIRWRGRKAFLAP